MLPWLATCALEDKHCAPELTFANPETQAARRSAAHIPRLTFSQRSRKITFCEAKSVTPRFSKTGHPHTLLAAFLYFGVSFTVWVILGPLGPFIGEAYHLPPAQKGLLTALPALGGSFFRPVLGWMTERFGGRATALIGLAFILLPLLGDGSGRIVS